MALIRWFSAEEKGKAPREGPDPLPPKKRLVLYRRDEGVQQEVSRPWCERPPPQFLLPLYAHLKGLAGADAERHGPHQPTALGVAWRLIGRGRLRFPMPPRQPLDLTSPCMQKWFMIT